MITIPLPASAFLPAAKAYEPAVAFVDAYVALRWEAHFTEDELPSVAWPLYLADLYYGQVCNGGHSQVVHNVSREALAGAVGGLMALGLDELLGCLQDLLAWIDAHPDEAAAQDGFGNRASDLDRLDERFFGPHEAYFAAFGAFLVGREGFEVVTDTAWSAFLEDPGALNPDFEARERVASLERAIDEARGLIGRFRAAVEGVLDDQGAPLELDRVTAGDPQEDGSIHWHLIAGDRRLVGVDGPLVTVGEPGGRVLAAVSADEVDERVSVAVRALAEGSR